MYLTRTHRYVVCGEFKLDDSSDSLNCVTCGCHRNFHRKVILVGAEIMIDSGTERSSKKRFRTRFTGEQKEKMLAFAGKLGWRLQRKDEEDEIERFCRGVGISRKVFKVWMHNHKNCTTTHSANCSSDLPHQS